jgi:hypothetical protein
MTDPTIALGVLFYAPAWGIAAWALCHLAHRGYLKFTNWLFYSEHKTQ